VESQAESGGTYTVKLQEIFDHGSRRKLTFHRYKYRDTRGTLAY
jgi:hypothetical protein